MFKEMRRKSKETSEEEALNILEKADSGVFSSISKNGYPYGVPVNYVYLNEAIYIHGAKEGHRLENIRENSKSSFTVVSYEEVIPSNFETFYDSVVVFGKAFEVIDEEEKTQALLKFMDKYSIDFLEKGKIYIEKSKDHTSLIKIEIIHMTGKHGR